MRDPVAAHGGSCGSGHPVHRPIDGGQANRDGRQAEQIGIAVDHHLGGEFGDAVERERRDIAVLGQRLAGPVRAVVPVDGA